jgi:DNA-binding response OmpR family regulator
MQRKRHCKLEKTIDRSLRSQPYRPGRILLVDDDPDEINAQVLREHGYEVVVARDGEAGWEELQTNRYNLVITENDLPVPSGVGLLKKLRSACMFLPVIIAIETLPSWQCADYPWLLKATKLLKPYSFEDLLGLVNSVLPVPGRRQEERAPLPNWQNQTASVALQL